jgi:phosphatidylethanolamine/phosphatidyl-N-methylethanolamine N-methyltransferase
MHVDAVYRRLAPVYDVMYGLSLEPGRRRAMARLDPRRGETILEVGVGTGLSALHYPPGCRVVAIDVCEPMLVRARRRLVRHGIGHVQLCRMDASNLALRESCFDAVYAPYVMNVVADPVRVARELLRVCRPGARLVLLNHFDAINGSESWFSRVLGQVAARAGGANWQLNLRTFLREAGLEAVSVEPVNALQVSAVVVCRQCQGDSGPAVPHVAPAVAAAPETTAQVFVDYAFGEEEPAHDLR